MIFFMDLDCSFLERIFNSSPKQIHNKLCFWNGVPPRPVTHVWHMIEIPLINSSNAYQLSQEPYTTITPHKWTVSIATKNCLIIPIF